MEFVEVQVHCNDEFREILIAEISNLEFDGMIETDVGFNACILADQFDEDLLKGVKNKYSGKILFDYNIQKIKKVNWNCEWESNFKPVEVDGKCRIRASFHSSDSSFSYEITINPKMSFGTGHHETTALMISSQLELDHQGRRILDCGCGTGILSIFAEKRGAKEIVSIDIDDWAIENSIENALANNCIKIKFSLGKVSKLQENRFDILLANINKNILLEELPVYSEKIVRNGYLLISGFYSNDHEEIVGKASQFGFTYVSKKEKNEWSSALFAKL